MLRRSALSFALIASFSSGALAASSIQNDARVATETQAFQGPVHLEARLGAGTSVGTIGAVGEWNVAEVLAVGVGVGTNGWPVLGGGARLRWPIWRSSKFQHAFTLEADYSRSKYRGAADVMAACLHSERCDVKLVPEMAHWFQAELGWELQSRSGFTFRLASGGAWLLNQIDWRCTDGGQAVPCEGNSGETSLPVMTVALGYAF
jgi:hypothetical protein